MGAQLLAQGADGVAQAGFAEELIFEPLQQSTPSRILLLFAVTLLPYSVIGPFTGVFVDRWSRRGLLIWTNVCRAGILVSLPLWSGALPGDAASYVGVLLVMGLGRLFLTTKGAALPVLVHEQALLRANSISSGGGMVAALVGGAAGIGIVGLSAPPAAYAISGLLYGGASLVAVSIREPMVHERLHSDHLAEGLRRVGRELRSGMVEVWRRERARLPLLGIFILRVTAMFVAIAAILVIKRDFPGAGDRIGRLSTSAIAVGAAGIGAFIGAATAPFLGRRISKPGLLLLGFVTSGSAMAVTGAALSLPMIMGMTLVGGFGAFVAKVSVDAQVQEAVPDGYRGRAFALYDILYNLASVVAAIIVALFAGVSLESLLMSMALVTLALAALLAAAMRRAGIGLGRSQG